MKLNKNTLIVAVGIAVLIAGLFYFLNVPATPPTPPAEIVSPDYKNIEYVILAERVKLTGGVSEKEAAPGSASMITTRYFGNEVWTDLNADGRDDVVFLLTQEGNGSGTFYFVVAALATDNGYRGSEALLLGDRIAPQTIEKVGQNKVVVNYADRAFGEPFSTPPSIAKSMVLILDPETLQFGEVAQDFEGEADPSRMSLGMKSWTWVYALYNDGKRIEAPQGEFILILLPDGTFSAQTDCNNVGGTYVGDATSLTFSAIHSTKMYCENSEESVFLTLLGDTQNYHFTTKGELVLDLKFDSGSVVLR